MYKIEPTFYGFRISISGSMDMGEAEQAKFELLDVLAELDRPFSLVIDVRKMIPYEPDVAKEITALHSACMRMSCHKTAIIVESPVLKGQAAQISFDAESASRDRVIDASKFSDWEDIAIAWVTNAADPETASRQIQPT